MTRRSHWLIIPLIAPLALGVALLLTVYLRTDSAGEAKLRVAAIMIEPETSLWKDAWNGVRDEAAAEGIAMSEYPYDSLTSNVAQLIETAILAKEGGIILRPQSAGTPEALDALCRARERGLFVVTVDLDTGEDLRDGFIGIDNEGSVQQIAECAARLFADGSVLIGSNPSIPPIGLERIAAFEETLAAYPDAAVETVKLPVDESLRQQELQVYLEVHPEISVAFCAVPKLTLTTAYAVQRLNIADRVSVIGFRESSEATGLLEKGVIYALIAQQPYEMGVYAVKCLKAAASGEEWEQSLSAMPYQIILRDGAAVETAQP